MKSALCLAVLTTLSISASASAAKESYRYRIKDGGANVNTWADTGCGYENFSISANESSTKDAPGAPVSSKQAYVSFSKYDYCTGVSSYGWASLEGVTFTIQGVKNASIKATGTMNVYNYSYTVDADGNYEYSYSEDLVPVMIDLSLVGTGDTYKGMNSSSSHNANSFYRSRYQGSNRQATVTGKAMIGDEGIDLSGAWGELFTATSGSVSIYSY